MEESVSQKEKERAEEAMIEQAFQELLNDYLATKHRKRVEIITKAFNFANQAHKGIKRRSGEPYIMHPIAVAKIVCNEIGLGSTSICAALLHDVVEDTDYTVEDIENIFGPKIAQIVDGLTKISGGIFGDRASAQAENFKKLLLTMSDDIRVILIKIADRLHNMRTLGSMLPNKQFKIAGETLYIYAPLANRLGLYKIKTELENLSFRYEHPEEYREIEKKLEATAVERDKVFKEFTAPIRAQLDKMGLKYRILARIKSIYSIWNKMQTKHVPFEEIYDLLAVRIIFEPRNMDDDGRKIRTAQTSFCSVHRIGGNKQTGSFAVYPVFLEITGNLQNNICRTSLNTVQSLIIRIGQRCQTEISGSAELIHQTAGHNATVIIDDIEIDILYLQIGSPRHQYHNHTREYENQLRQE